METGKRKAHHSLSNGKHLSLEGLKETTGLDNKVKLLCGYVSIPNTVPITYGKRNESRGTRMYLKDHQGRCSPSRLGVKPVTVNIIKST